MLISGVGGIARGGVTAPPGTKLANDGHDTRALQHYLGHRNIQHTVRYTELALLAGLILVWPGPPPRTEVLRLGIETTGALNRAGVSVEEDNARKTARAAGPSS